MYPICFPHQRLWRGHYSLQIATKRKWNKQLLALIKCHRIKFCIWTHFSLSKARLIYWWSFRSLRRPATLSNKDQAAWVSPRAMGLYRSCTTHRWTVESNTTIFKRNTRQCQKELGRKKRGFISEGCWLKGYSQQLIYTRELIKNASSFFNQNCWFSTHTILVPLCRFKTFRVPEYNNRRAFGILMPISHTFRFIWYGFPTSPQSLWMTSTTKAIQLRLALCRVVIILTVSSPRAPHNLHKDIFCQTFFENCSILIKKSKHGSAFQWLSWLFEQGKRKAEKFFKYRYWIFKRSIIKQSVDPSTAFIWKG